MRSPLTMPCLVAAMLLSRAAAHAQDFPTRPITILVGVAPGGVTDLATRAYANAVAKNTGWKVVVENRTGAGGAVAAKAVESAAPDGYTLLTVVGAQFASIPAMQSPSAIRSHSRLPADHADIPARAIAGGAGRILRRRRFRNCSRSPRRRTAACRSARPAPAAPAHLLGAKIALATGTPMQYVHYRGGPPMIADLVTGRIDFGLLSYIAAKPHIDDKKLKGLVIDAEARIDQIPNVPTLIEAGLAKERVANWFGLAAPAGTPAAVVTTTQCRVRAGRQGSRCDQAARGGRRAGRDLYAGRNGAAGGGGGCVDDIADHGARAAQGIASNLGRPRDRGDADILRAGGNWRHPLIRGERKRSKLSRRSGQAHVSRTPFACGTTRTPRLPPASMLRPFPTAWFVLCALRPATIPAARRAMC